MVIWGRVVKLLLVGGTFLETYSGVKLSLLLLLYRECVTEGTTRSSKLVSEEASEYNLLTWLASLRCSVWQTDIEFGSKFVDFLSGWLPYASHTLFTTRPHCT